MAQYQSFEPDIECKGAEITSIVNELRKEEIIEKYQLSDDPKSWNDLQSVLDALKEVSDDLGDMALFLMGKGVIERATFPPMDGLKNALETIDVAYHMNHRKNGQVLFDAETGKMHEGIGHFTLTHFDEGARVAEMICRTPYPSKFEEGLIVQIVRMFKPSDSLLPSVELDTTKETRRDEGESCTFQISW